MKVEIVSIAEITPYDKNPRNNDDAIEPTAKSIKQFGWKQPIVVDKNNVIVVGHTWYRAAKNLKLKEVTIIYAKHMAYRIISTHVKKRESYLWFS